MKFGKRSPEESAYGNNEHNGGLTIKPLVAVAVVSLACGCMVGAYFLGFRAGHTNGLELALANSVSQVVRSPVARIGEEKSAQVNDSSDVYAKLKEPLAAREESQNKQVDASKEVKEFLAPTATPSTKSLSPNSKAGSIVANNTVQNPNAIANETVPSSAFQEKKLADSAAIEHALNDAKTQENAILKDRPGIEDKAVRVIGGSATESKSISSDKPKHADAKEDFSEPPAGAALKNEAEKSENAKAVTQKASALNDKATDLVKKPTPQAQYRQILPSSEIKPKANEIQKPEIANKASIAEPAPSALPTGWYLQIAAPRSLTEAQEIAGHLRSGGFKSRIETADVRDQKYYRVLVGPDANRPAAEQSLTRLKNKNIVKTEPFIRMVK